MPDITGVGAVADLANIVVSKIWPDKSEEEKQQLAAAVMVVQGQIDTNKTEASNTNVFVSGWRPFIGWICGAACVWNWIGLSIVHVVLEMVGQSVKISPADLSEMLPVLTGMLGLGGLRTIEKINGVASK